MSSQASRRFPVSFNGITVFSTRYPSLVKVLFIKSRLIAICARGQIYASGKLQSSCGVKWYVYEYVQ
ncbi:hypothetical protein AcV5_008069 [Taiwanofungus camphoratus]|nr:hypothetical protein AcV5_008069 [Antrodia cinnamomea]